MVDRLHNISRFGEVEFDLDHLTLTRAGVVTPLGDQPARVLRYLIEHAGRVVTRDELYDAFWPKNLAGAEQSLNAAIRRIRRAVADDAQTPCYIETVPRRGYRFITNNVAQATLPRQGPLSISGRMAASIWAKSSVVAVLSLAFFAWAGTHTGQTQTLLEISNVQSNCADPNTVHFEQVLQFEALMAVRANGFDGAISSSERPAAQIPLTSSHKLDILANYGATDGDIYVRLLDKTNGRVIWTRKYAVDLERTRDAVKRISAGLQNMFLGADQECL